MNESNCCLKREKIYWFLNGRYLKTENRKRRKYLKRDNINYRHVQTLNRRNYVCISNKDYSNTI